MVKNGRSARAGTQPKLPTEAQMKDVTVQDAVKATAEDPGAATQRGAPAATPAAEEAKEAEVVAAPVSDTRKAQIAELPSMMRFTGIKAVAQGMTICVVPLRKGSAAQCHLNEKTPLYECVNKANLLHELIDEAMKTDQANDDVGLTDLCPDGIVDIKARSNKSFRCGHIGIFDVRILEDECDYLFGILEQLGCAAQYSIFDELPDDTYEIAVPTDLFPGAVVEQIYLQNNGLAALFKRDFGAVGDKAFVYQVVMEDGRHLTDVATRGYLVELGSYGKWAPRNASAKATSETIYMFGMRGLESAKLDFRPAFASAIGQSQDLVKVSKTPGTMHDTVVCPIKYQFSREASDAVDRMLDQGCFKLENVRTGSIREIYLAANLKELQKMLAFKLVRGEESEAESDDDEEPRFLDVSANGDNSPSKAFNQSSESIQADFVTMSASGSNHRA